MFVRALWLAGNECKAYAAYSKKSAGMASSSTMTESSGQSMGVLVVFMADKPSLAPEGVV